MENSSTPPRASTPWIANLATLAVVIAAIGWSSEQRPAAPMTEAAATTPVAPQPLPVSDSPPSAIPAATQSRWPVQTTAVSSEGLQVVGFQAPSLR